MTRAAAQNLRVGSVRLKPQEDGGGYYGRYERWDGVRWVTMTPAELEAHQTQERSEGPPLQAQADALANRIRSALRPILHPESSFSLTLHVRKGSILVKDLTIRPSEGEGFKPR